MVRVKVQSVAYFKDIRNTDVIFLIMLTNARSLPLSLSSLSLSVCLQLSPTDKSLEFDRDFRIRHYAGDVV